MNQEDKELLLKDLCARLPYKIRCSYYDICLLAHCNGEIYGIENKEYAIVDGKCIAIEFIKPYLFPLSSMTEEQRNELKSLLRPSVLKSLDEDYKDNEDIEFPTLISANPSVVEIDFYHKNHFDYRGLIEKELAIDCTNLDIY